MVLVESIITQARKLESALNQALLRLPDATDHEALHDVRINLRRLRSLLRPLRGTPGVAQLDDAAAKLGKITTPMRDLEVLITELDQHQLTWQANTRKTELQSRKLALTSLPLLIRLPTLLHAWLNMFLITKHRHTKHRIAHQITQQVKQVRLALADSYYDRHRLRLLVKHLRYVVDAYPQFRLITPDAIAHLKTAQSTLGHWHDHVVWYQMAEHQQDLWPLLPQWQSAIVIAQENAEAALLLLSQTLSTTDKKHAKYHNPNKLA
ncbi:CHAD domain-containing protein [Serratia sp. PL17]|uniref:CHAD domain-containing protein n=1 Tax=Serratia sp. PL17 TaxID=2806582 RepID=UPI001AE69632|nr:CHAD domain-containing protein [Serratia sp. PL17]MBP1133380.1 CHAD domain-containing protein [Serratia sp. PL17]